MTLVLLLSKYDCLSTGCENGDDRMCFKPWAITRVRWLCIRVRRVKLNKNVWSQSR